MVTLTAEKIAKIKESLAKMNRPISPIKPALEPIYDDIYFQGLDFLNRQDGEQDHE